MKYFNWEEFKKGNIEVGCKTEELAKDFLKQCLEHEVKWGRGVDIDLTDTQWGEYKKDTLYGVWKGDEKYLYYSSKIGGLYYGDSKEHNKQFVEWTFEEKEESKTKYSFTEIVANRKPGQVWEGQVYEIVVDGNSDIILKFKDGGVLGDYINLLCSSEQYILKETVSFDIALSECEKNIDMRMKSLVSNREYRVNGNEIETLSASGLFWLGTSLCYEEIKGDWVVYDNK